MTIEKIEEVICELHNVTVEDLKSKSPKMIYYTPRQLIIYFAYKLINMKKLHLAKRYEKNHSTIHKGIDKIENIISYDKKYKQEIEQLQQLLIQS